jgi:DNA-binding response OmpR family regulator
MLSALGTFDNRVAGFDAGADDYVIKPFDIRELVARINVFIKRSDTGQPTEKLCIADLEMDLATKRVNRGNLKLI